MVIIQDVTLEWERASSVVTQRNVNEGLRTVLFQKRDDTDENPSRNLPEKEEFYIHCFSKNCSEKFPTAIYHSK